MFQGEMFHLWVLSIKFHWLLEKILDLESGGHAYSQENEKQMILEFRFTWATLVAPFCNFPILILSEPQLKLQDLPLGLSLRSQLNENLFNCWKTCKDTKS